MPRWFCKFGRSMVGGLLALGAVTHCAVAQAGTALVEMQANLPLPAQDIVLEVHGNIANTNIGGAAKFDMEMLLAIPSVTLKTSTAVTDGTPRFDGILMQDLLALLGADGRIVTATAINDYVIDIPIEDFERFDVVLVYQMDGEYLLPSNKGPLWIVYPRDHHAELQDIRYDYRWVWQLRRLDIQ